MVCKYEKAHTCSVVLLAESLIFMLVMIADGPSNMGEMFLELPVITSNYNSSQEMGKWIKIWGLCLKCSSLLFSVCKLL